MTDADLVVALHFARNGSPEGHRVQALETQIAALKEVVANAKATIEQRRQESDILPSQMAKQLAPNDKPPGRARPATGRHQRLLATDRPKAYLAMRLQWPN